MVELSDKGDVRPPVVDLRGVERTYPGPPRVRALLPCMLTIGEGDHVAVTGPSGSGKSTLMNVLGLLDRPTGGQYHLAGHDVSALSDRARASYRGRHIGFIFQGFHLVEWRTAAQNVEMGLLYQRPSRRHRQERVAEALRRVGLAHRAQAPAQHLSGGERQRVAIARAILGQPRLLLCDEPTGNLDSRSADRVLELLKELNADGHTLIVVTHDEGVAGQARRRVHIRDGQVAEFTREPAVQPGDRTP